MEKGRTQKGSDSLLRQKLAEGLVLSDTEHDLAMQVHKYGSQEATANPEGVSYKAMEPSSWTCPQRVTNTRRPPSLSALLPAATHTYPRLSHFLPAGAPSSPKLPPPLAHQFPSRAADPTNPMMAKAGSSCRSKGKSIRKLVLKRAVMVTVEWKGQASWWERHRNPGGKPELSAEGQCLPSSKAAGSSSTEFPVHA